MKSIVLTATACGVFYITFNSAFADKTIELCEQKKRTGIENALELIGIRDPLVTNRKDCQENRLRTAREKMHIDYMKTNSPDKNFRETYLTIAPRTGGIQSENSGQLSTIGAFRELNEDDSSPSLPTATGYSNVTLPKNN